MSKPFNLNGLQTYPLQERPSKVFVEELGQPVGPDATIDQWLDSLPDQLAGKSIRRTRELLIDAYDHEYPVVAAIGGHVIKTGCGPYLIDWMKRGLLTGIAMNGSAAIHDAELALAGKTSEDVASSLNSGQFGMARETADIFAVASRRGAEEERGLGAALGAYLDSLDCKYADSSVLVTAHRYQIPCTVHVAIGADIVHMHPHVSGAALGESSHIDFRRVCTQLTTMAQGIWMNIGSAVMMPEVLLKAVSVVRNFGYSLDDLVTINLDKSVQYRSAVNVLDRPSAEGIQLTGHHEILVPLLHASVIGHLVSQPKSTSTEQVRHAA